MEAISGETEVTSKLRALAMTGNLLNRIASSLLLSILVSCTNIQATETPAIVATAQIVRTSTALPPTLVPSTTIPASTPTSNPPCNPFKVDYCITDGHFILQRPIQPPGNDLVDPTYRYGSTANGTREPHHGVEFPNPSGTPVHAAASGTVIFAGPDKEAIFSPWRDFYGNLVVIEHEGDLFTLYAHLSRVDVTTGQKVLAADQIGEVGRTGGAIGSHLHFEVRTGDVKDYFATQNPELWMLPPQDANRNRYGALMISVVGRNGDLIKHANFTIGYYFDPSQPPTRVYYATPYSPDMLRGEESAVSGELSVGRYRIAVETNGQIYERWVEVQSGKLTQVVFVIR